MELSIVIPVYNEEENIEPLVSELTTVMSRLQQTYEIVIVDDGSRDGTFAKLRVLLAQRPELTIMRLKRNFGQTAAVAAGLAHEIRNPLAGIAGVIEIVSRDLPPNSAARSVIKDAKEEALQINRILTDLLETARPKPPQFQVRDLAFCSNLTLAMTDMTMMRFTIVRSELQNVKGNWH